jgi:hypothetical protein
VSKRDIIDNAALISNNNSSEAPAVAGGGSGRASSGPSFWMAADGKLPAVPMTQLHVKLAGAKRLCYPAGCEHDRA